MPSTVSRGPTLTSPSSDSYNASPTARTVTVRAVGDALYESELGEVKVGPRETVDGIELTTVDVGNPHAVVVGDPGDVTRLGPLLETHPRFPNRTNVQVARIDGPGEVTALSLIHISEPTRRTPIS